MQQASFRRRRAIGVTGAEIPELSRITRKGGVIERQGQSCAGARLALPLNHAAFPRNAAQLRELGAGYTNCAPTPEARLLYSLQAQLAEARQLLG